MERDDAAIRRPVTPFWIRGIEDGTYEAPDAGRCRERVYFVHVSFHRFRGRRPARGPASRQEARPFARDGLPPAPISPEIVAAVAASPFTALGLAPPLVRAIVEESYEQPSPIQAEVVPHALARRDVIGCAQTGTGKTAAFLLPLLQHLAASTSPRIRALILTPTRELAAQIAERVTVYGRHLELRHALLYGGVSQRPQEASLRASPDLVVATPGRLLDLVDQGLVDLGGITHFVLDEADRMLDMGFVHAVRRVVALVPRERQTLFFSATMAPAIEKLARGLLLNPVRVAIAPAETTAQTVDQSVVFVARSDKCALLRDVLRDESVRRALVFTRTKHGANRLSDELCRAGIGSLAIHGNKTQGARERALDAFRRGRTRVLVATDVAARGIDVEAIGLVVNFDLPNVAESYVHRVGRTGRAGASGRAISFCDKDERAFLADIERLIRRPLRVSKRSPEGLGSPRADKPAPRNGAERPAGLRATTHGCLYPARLSSRS
jgi:ATP-dependent RNA helicase RhlE